MRVITSNPVLNFNGDGLYENANGKKQKTSLPKTTKVPKDPNAPKKGLAKVASKVGHGLAKAAKATGHGLAKAASAVGHAIVKAEQFVVKESKVFAKGVKKAGGKIKTGTKKLIHKKNKDGIETFQKPLTPVVPDGNGYKKVNADGTQTTLTKSDVIPVNNQFIAKLDTDPKKAITVSTNPETGATNIGQDYAPEEVVGQPAADGNIEYFHVTDEEGKMSPALKWGLIGGGALIVIIVIVVIIRKNKKKS